MTFTASPVSSPPSSSRFHANRLRTPNTSNPQNTADTDSSAERAVRTMSYRTGSPGVEKPSIAMKCMTQMPTPPIDTAASASQVSRVRALSVVRACSVQASPSAQPTTEVKYASTTSQWPIAKSSWSMCISVLLSGLLPARGVQRGQRVLRRGDEDLFRRLRRTRVTGDHLDLGRDLEGFAHLLRRVLAGGLELGGGPQGRPPPPPQKGERRGAGGPPA